MMIIVILRWLGDDVIDDDVDVDDVDDDTILAQSLEFVYRMETSAAQRFQNIQASNYNYTNTW